MNKDFLSNIKPGQYIKTEHRDEKRVRKVAKVTKTQIVISEWGWGEKPHIERFRISNGCRIGDSWYYLHRISEDPVSPEESAAYEARIDEGERLRRERKRLAEVETWAKDRLVALFGGNIPSDNIKISLNSNDGLKTVLFEIKCEKINEDALTSALKMRSENEPQINTACSLSREPGESHA